MCAFLKVQWTITPQTPPQPWLACSGCGTLKPFECSGKIRLNANGRKLDAWLIYKCTSCDKTWNRPIFERRNIRDIASAELLALQSNDPDWIRAEAFEIAVLRRKARRIDEFDDYGIRKEVLQMPLSPTALLAEMAVPIPVSVRLDRLLASELGISRARVRRLHEGALLRTTGPGGDSLRKPVANGVVVTVDMSGEDDREMIWRAVARNS